MSLAAAAPGSFRSKWLRIASTIPAPRPIAATETIPKKFRLPASSADKNHVLLIKKTLELLWKCELILLVEYIETAISLLYSIYLVVLCHLPNAKYYIGMDALTLDNLDNLQWAVAWIILYAMLEALSLVCVHAVLMPRFHVSALHQLAFVFENDWLVVQGAFMA